MAAPALEDCRLHTIKYLKQRVTRLEGELENYDTTDAQNHAVEQVVKALTRILDERQQVGQFGGPTLQALAERLLMLMSQP